MSALHITSSNDDYVTSVTCTGARRRHDTSLVGQLNGEWASLRTDPVTIRTVADWATAEDALADCTSLHAIEQAVSSESRERTDDILLALLRLGQAGQALASRTVFQLMLGKAIRIAATHAGRDTRHNLEHAAITALWTVIATYPIDRRPTKVAANIAMDTLRYTVGELSHQRNETPVNPEVLYSNDTDHDEQPADLELVNLLTWAVDNGTITSRDATLVLDIYVPAPGRVGGQAAAADHGLSWTAARQRASRAIRRVTQAVQADSPAAAA